MKIVWYISAGLLFLGAISMPSGYYELLRWVICAAAAFAAYTNYSIEKTSWAIGFGIVALIFNPIAPVYLYDKFVWMVIDISAGLLFVINSKEIKD
tara:strand:- start:13 stop:300 length:288 start_codon:yes stop_codon:yes gene_type:complete